VGVGTDEVAIIVKQYEQAFVDVVIYARVFIDELNTFHGELTDLPDSFENDHRLPLSNNSSFSATPDPSFLY